MGPSAMSPETPAIFAVCNCISATFKMDDFSGDYDDAFACSTPSDSFSDESEEELMLQQQEADDLFSRAPCC